MTTTLPDFINDQEDDGWSNIRDFLRPEQWDNDALTQFLELYLRRTATTKLKHYDKNQNQTEGLGYLLRSMDATHPLWTKTLLQWYSDNFKSYDEYFSEWFVNLGDKRGNVKTWMLDVLNAAPPIEVRVALMMHGVEHFPEEPIQSFIGKSLLRIKPSGFVRALKPTFKQMPLVLNMAQELYTQGDKELAQSIALAVFVQRLSVKPDDNNPQRQDSVIEAWSLITHYDVGLTPQQYMDYAKSRLKSDFLYKDSMYMMSWALELQKNEHIKEISNDQLRNDAATLTPTILRELIAQKDYGDEYVQLLYNNYSKSVESTSEVRELVYQFFEGYLLQGCKRHPYLLLFLDKHYPEKQDYHWDLWRLNGNTKEDPNSFLLKLCKNAIYNFSIAPTSYVTAVLNHYKINDVVDVLRARGAHVYDFEKIKTESIYWNQNNPEFMRIENEKYQLRTIEEYLALLTVMSPKMNGHKGFELLARTATMTYLYMCKNSNRLNDHYNPFNGVFPNLIGQPLPLLKALYPEQQEKINKLHKDLYTSMVSNPTYTSKLDVSVVNKYYTDLYTMLSGVLFDFKHCQEGSIQALFSIGEMSVFDYFSTINDAHVVRFENLNGAIFDFNSSQ